jgi:hypothetical protein
MRERARVVWKDQAISFQGEEGLIASLKKGVMDPITDQMIQPENGFVFLAAVSRAFNQPYLLASEVVREE